MCQLLIPLSSPSLLPISSLIVPHIFCKWSDNTLSLLMMCCHCSFSIIYALYRLHTTTLAYVQLVHHFSYQCPSSTSLSCPCPVSIPPLYQCPMSTQSLYLRSSHYIIIYAHIQQYPISPAHILYFYCPINLVHHLS